MLEFMKGIGKRFTSKPELVSVLDDDRSVKVEELLADTIHRVTYLGTVSAMREIKRSKGWFGVDGHSAIEASYLKDIEARLSKRKDLLPQSLQEDVDHMTFIIATLGMNERIYGDDGLPSIPAIWAHIPLAIFSDEWKSRRDPDINDWDKTIEVGNAMLDEGLIKSVPVKDRFLTHYIYLDKKIDPFLA